MRPSAGIRQSSATSASSDQSAPGGDRGERAQARRLDERRRVEELGAFRQRLEELAVLGHLIRATARRTPATHRQTARRSAASPGRSGRRRSPATAPPSTAPPSRTPRRAAIGCSSPASPRASGPTAPARSPGTSRRAGRCGCRTAARRRRSWPPRAAATSSQVIGARLTAAATSDRQAAASTKGATHQTSSGRSSRMMAVSVRTESGTPSSSPAGRSSRVHTVDELAQCGEWSPPACRARSRCATSRCGRSRPGADTGARARRRGAPAATARRRSAARRHARAASSSDGGMAISSDRSGALTNTRTRRRPASSVVENIPKPPPFHGLRPAVLASVTCAPATRPAARRAAARAIAARAASARRPPASLQHDHLISGRHARVIRRAALRVGRRCRRARSCSWPAAS